MKDSFRREKIPVQTLIFRSLNLSNTALASSEELRRRLKMLQKG